ncbi:hypothetical protein E2P81_ATG04697 [Venturia nashicola]|uniref:BRCT domain-containing protein n=1 Tax=Venturia nashicola TaxID=86259 RepID=A0A4Z1P1X5_9PEZI|nr:hypothetical protein E6O75_ATG04808 [Venturia nashicola]TLD34532.1 hypothetical protein E2P81_ATG04697 [Venturia nashicola]
MSHPEQPDEELQGPGIFHDAIFTIIPSDDLKGDDLQQLADLIVKGEGQYQPLDPKTNRIKDIKELNLIISTTADFPDYKLAIESFIHVVKPSYISHCIEKKKQINPRQFSPDHNMFMSDVVIACGAIPGGDQEAIAGGVIAMGGTYSQAMSKLVTHLIVLTDDDPRSRTVKDKNLKCKVLMPHWFDDCLRLGRRIREEPYTFPDPEILYQQRNSKPPKPQVSDDVKGASSPHPAQMPTPDPSFSGSTRRLTVFKDRKIILSDDLAISTSLRRVLDDLITTGGGHVVEGLNECDTLVCQYREGEQYVTASQAGREVGNLGWLYHMITHNRWTVPTRRLLHYPVPKNGVPGFEDFTISVSNYAGESRLYLENLVKACGGAFTKTMRQDNTHLITAHTASEKCDAAREWNIELVNHLWLEESYAQHRVAPLTTKKYTHFPPRTNLGEIVGQTRIDRAVVEKYFYPRSAVKKGKKGAKLLSDAPNMPQESSNLESLETIDTATPPPEEPEEADHMDVDEEPPTAVQKSKRGRTSKAVATDDEHEPPATAAKTRRSKTEPGLKTPALRKFVDSEKENETPGTSGSRGAKARAMSKLHDAAADIALYDKERKRVGGVTHGRDRRESTMDPDTPAVKEKRGRKRQSTEMEAEPEEETEEEAPADGKRGKRVKSGEKLPNIEYRMVLTGYQRWVDDPKSETTERNTLRNLGISIVEDTMKVDILCAPKIVRTKKFISALARAPFVVSTSFLDFCLKNQKVPDPNKFSLQDRDTEQKTGMKLQESIELAEKNDGQLLQGWQIFCTSDVTGGFDTYKTIIEANGGVAMLYKGRTAMNVSKRRFNAGPAGAGGAAESQGDANGNTLYLISGEKPSESGLWDKFRQMAKAADMVPVIARSDWMISVAMRQLVHWDDKWKL